MRPLKVHKVQSLCLLYHTKKIKKSVGLYISYDLHKASEFKVRVQTEHKLPCYSYCTLHLH